MSTATVAPLVSAPAPELIDRIGSLASPALLYDFDGLARSIRILTADIATAGSAELNLALKSCHTPRVLAFLAGLGLGADVASMGELELAVAAGFGRITATGPAFTVADLDTLDAHSVVLDASSIEQFEEVCAARPGGAAGLRIRVPLPTAITDQRTTFGENSRFGVLASDRRIAETLARTGARLSRLHTHTGQITPQHQRYKLRYLLTVAQAFPDVVEIDLGGGFFSLYADRRAALAIWSEVRAMLADFERLTGRGIHLQVEPGGALLAPHGYLLATVRSAETGHPGLGADLLTVDCSAWNLAPWHRPQVVPLTPPAPDERLRATLIAGNTLYENDFFGTDVLGRRSTFQLPQMRAGDRLVLTAAGAYTMTNARRFNRLPLPAEYLLTEGRIDVIE
jgi:diaminopimelate decarboxylase